MFFVLPLYGVHVYLLSFSSTFFACSPEFSVSSDTIFPYIPPYITPRFHYEHYEHLGVSAIYILHVLSFVSREFRLVFSLRFHYTEPIAFHRLPTYLSYKFTVWFSAFLVCPAMCSRCVSLNGTSTFYRWFPVNSLLPWH